MMRICDCRHVQIIHEEEECPMCLIKEELKDADSELSGALRNLECAESRADDLESQVEELRKGNE